MHAHEINEKAKMFGETPFPRRSSKPVPTVVHDENENKNEAEFIDLRAGQWHLLDTLEQDGR